MGHTVGETNSLKRILNKLSTLINPIEPMSLNDEEIQQARYDLIELKIEHSDLDHAIEIMLQHASTDQLRLRRMKKRKLKLKDNIQRLKSMVIPDMDA